MTEKETGKEPGSVLPTLETLPEETGGHHFGKFLLLYTHLGLDMPFWNPLSSL